MIQTVAYLGNFGPSHSTENHIAATLEALGIQVDRIQEPNVKAKVPQTLRRIRQVRADLLLYTRTWGLLKGDLWGPLEARGVQTASYHLDLYYGLPRGQGIATDPFWRTQHVFTPDGDPEAEAWFASQGVNHHWIRPGVYGPECIPGTPNPDLYPHPIVFVGTWNNYHPEWPHRKKLVAHLRHKWGKQVGLYGSGGLGAIRNLRLNDLYATATVVVGDSFCPGYTKPNYWSDRAYETVGRGGFLLHPYVQGMELDFTDGEHLRFWQYGDFDQLDDMIQQALDNPHKARVTADQGQRHVASFCTYRERLIEALAILEA